MIGGGLNAFIGEIHRKAAFMDNQIEMVCGCFSSDPERSKASGHAYFLPADRVYSSYQEMFEKESQLPASQQMDFVAIVTPNHHHFEPAMMALERGYHVVLDKPMTFSLEEAVLLQKKVEETGLLLALTHTYSGYPAVKEARKYVADGLVGNIRKIIVEYSQGWLSERIELQEGNNAGWRTDPARSGKAGCIGDIGTHAWHLSEYISGLKVTELCAQLNTFVPGRPIDDDGAALLRYEGGVAGVLSASQVAIGEENRINIRIYGDKAALEWHQMEPNTLLIRWPDRPTEIVRVGNGYMSKVAQWNSRTPGGHPEGYIEAFANIYRNFACTLRALKKGEKPGEYCLDFPTVYDGVRGMEFIETMVMSGYDTTHKWQKWITLDNL